MEMEGRDRHASNQLDHIRDQFIRGLAWSPIPAVTHHCDLPYSKILAHIHPCRLHGSHSSVLQGLEPRPGGGQQLLLGLRLCKGIQHQAALDMLVADLPVTSQEWAFSAEVSWHVQTGGHTPQLLTGDSVRHSTKDPAGRAGLKPVLQGSALLPKKGPWMGQLRFYIRLWHVQTLPMTLILTYVSLPHTRTL